MVATVEYQAWDSTTYNWLDTVDPTSAPNQIFSKLSAWCTAINANPSNVAKQVITRKGPTDSTSANFVGFVLEITSPSAGASCFLRFHTTTATNILSAIAASWTDDGANGGYGTTSGSASNDSSVSWLSSGVAGEFTVAYDTADGVEFFALGWRLNNATSSSDQMCLFKDTNGEWAYWFSDGGSVTGSFYMPNNATPARNFGIYGTNPIGVSNQSGTLTQLVISAGSIVSSVPAGGIFTNLITAASLSLFMNTNTTEYGYGRWASLVDGRIAVCIGYGPLWIAY